MAFMGIIKSFASRLRFFYKAERRARILAKKYPQVVIHKGADIDAARIAQGTSVGANTIIKECEIGQGSIINENVHLTSSKLGARANMGHGAIVQESLLEEDVTLHSGIRLKNDALADGLILPKVLWRICVP